MKTTLVIFIIISLSVIDPLCAFVAPTTLFTAPLPITSQFHSQDSIGQYAYGYSGGPSIKTESKSFDGIIRGSYSYIDPDGKLQTVEYTADALNGFRAAATNLPRAPVDDKLAPEPVQETPEVAKARAEHLAAYKEAEIRAAKYPEEPVDVQENTTTTNNGNGGEIAAAVPSPTTGTQETEVAPIESLPASTTLTLPAPITTLKALELPASSYSYRVESPIHGYSVVAPTVFTSPLTTGYSTLTTGPLITGVRPLSVSTRILTDRGIELARNHNGNGGL